MKYYNYKERTFKNEKSNDKMDLPNDKTEIDCAEDLYSRLGERFPITWPANSPAEPILDSNELPESITLTDVETTISNMISEGDL